MTDNRYAKMFSALAERDEGAFVPFIMLSDPNAEDCLDTIRAVVGAGADALELGVPFSDPVADGPTIQASHIRALDGGATVDQALEIIRTVRAEFPELPIGMLIYGNVAFTRGRDKFYAEFHDAGADSILLPDVPVREGEPFAESAKKAGIDPIFIAPARATDATLAGVAALSEGYIYAISRDGVTGTERSSETLGLEEVVNNVARHDGPPVLLGFGISQPEHVRDAIAAGASGAITGSAITQIINEYVERTDPDDEHSPARVTDRAALDAKLNEYVSAMKAATRR